MTNYFRLLPFILIITVLAACADDSDVENAVEDENATDGEASGGDFVVSTGNDVVSLDPHGNNDLYSDQVRNTIYEGLVTQDEDVEIVPLLAESYEQTDDTTWTFNLRDDVLFHDGTEFNAESVKANLERVIDPAVASPRLNIFEMIEAVNVIDDDTVEIVTEYTFAPLLNHLTHDGGGMISQAVIDEDYENALQSAGHDMSAEEYYDLRDEGGAEYESVVDDISDSIGEIVETKPVGTNYAKFSSRSPGEQTVLERFDDYWDEPMALDTITYKLISETASRIADLETGNSHMILGFDGSDLGRIEDHQETEPYTLYNIAVEYIGFNTQKEPLDDKRVRQAISHVVDREELIEGVYSGTGRVPKGIVTPELLGHDDSLEGYEYDIERAEELMAEAGYEDGFDISILTNDAEQRVNTAVYLQEALQSININASVEQLEWAAFLEAAGSGDHDIFIQGHPNATGDPDQSLWGVFHSSMQGNGGNRTFFDNEEVDSLLEAGRQTTDDDERVEIYHEAQEILEEEAPMVYIRQAESLNAYRNEDVEGLYIDTYNKPDFRNVELN